MTNTPSEISPIAEVSTVGGGGPASGLVSFMDVSAGKRAVGIRQWAIGFGYSRTASYLDCLLPIAYCLLPTALSSPIAYSSNPKRQGSQAHVECARRSSFSKRHLPSGGAHPVLSPSRDARGDRFPRGQRWHARLGEDARLDGRACPHRFRR